MPSTDLIIYFWRRNINIFLQELFWFCNQQIWGTTRLIKYSTAAAYTKLEIHLCPASRSRHPPSLSDSVQIEIIECVQTAVQPSPVNILYHYNISSTPPPRQRQTVNLIFGEWGMEWRIIMGACIANVSPGGVWSSTNADNNTLPGLNCWNAVSAVARYSRYQYFILPRPGSFKYLVPRGLTHSSRTPGMLMMSDKKKEQQS